MQMHTPPTVESARRRAISTIEELCCGLPDEFEQFLRYCRTLNYDEKPDYGYLQNIFGELYNKMGFEHGTSFDWTEKAIEESKRRS
jgi:casein kinase 1